ncbi:MAG: 3-isopropylmalate dehydratase large subunit [Deltaproteobacteria bacterium]|nr:3-isopropylmalate dehydratase large subunit [Deltaproteobacteria bacterium]
MGMTITEKILAAHAGVKQVEPGQLITAKVDIAMGNDVTAPLAIEVFRKAGATRVYDPERVTLVLSHFVPTKDILAADMCTTIRRFAREQGLTYFYEEGKGGIEHVLLPEEGVVVPGDVVIGADSHTCTYGALNMFSTGVGSTDLAAVMLTGECWLRVPETMKFIYTGKPGKWIVGKDLILRTIGDIGVDGALYRAMEFTGEAIGHLSMSDRFTMTNMVQEAGGKNGVMEADDKTRHYAEARCKRPPRYVSADPDAKYCDVREYDISTLEPLVAFPHLPSNIKPLSAVGKVEIDKVFIGSCTNGKLEDMRVAAQIMKGKKVHPYVRVIVIPATQGVYREALKEGLIEIFIEAGATVSAATCGPCLGGHMGVLGKGERCVSTSNRNFVGRMGHPESETFLVNPAVAAASAVLGRIAHPDEVQ